MVFLQNCLKIFVLLAFFTCLSHPSEAQDYKTCEDFAKPSDPWTELVFKGSKLITNITVTIRLRSADTLLDDLTGRTQEDLTYCAETVHKGKLLSVKLSYEVAGFTQDQYEERIWFNESAIRPAKRIRLSNGNSSWVKSYCFEESGVRRQKFTPADSREASLSPAVWTKRSESFYRYPEKVAECATISDPILVFYMLSAFQAKWQQLPNELCTFGKKKLHLLNIRQKDTSPLKTFYEKRSLDTTNTIEDIITPLVFSLGTHPLTPEEKSPEIFSFLGLHKDIRIYIDPQRRLPVKISGTNNSIGNLVLSLRSFSN